MPATRTLTIASGTRYFQAKFISRSTRIRGRVALIQNIRKMKNSTFAHEDRDQDQVDHDVRERRVAQKVRGKLDERDRRPAAQEQGRRQAAHGEHAQVLGQEEQAEPHARVLGVIAGDDLRLGFGQVERRAVHLGDAGDQAG